MPTPPLVSVIMPMRNSVDMIGASIRSVQAQTFTDWELVVVDDRSTDDSYAVVRAFAEGDRRVRLLRNPGRQGAAHARNHATEHARGRYIAFLDSDDMWLATKLERQLELMTATGTPLTYAAYYKITGDEQVEAAAFTPSRRVVRAPTRLTYAKMLRQDYVGFLTAMYDTRAVGKRYFPDLARRQDYAMLLELFRTGITARGTTEPLAIYRAARSGSLSSNKIQSSQYNWQIYRHIEGLPLWRAMWAFANYAVRSGLKYLI